MNENLFKQARLRAAEKDNRFKSVSGAAQHLPTISRERLLMIEQEDSKKRQCDPLPADVAELAEMYGAPELCDYFCTHLCPLGEGRSPLMYNNLGEISAKLMASLHFLENMSDPIHRVLEDSQVTEDEKTEFAKIIQTLRNLAYSADSLELWAKRNGYVD